jgi:hypothetical protein
MAARNPWLIAAAWMSVAATVLHLTCIVGGPGWYRFFGAGEAMAHSAIAFAPAFLPLENRTMAFIVTTSAICLVMGLCFATRTWRAWPQLSQRKA